MLNYRLQVTNAPHKAKLSHELIAAAASYEVVPLFCAPLTPS
jgi:Protein of unknown function (DUF3759)